MDIILTIMRREKYVLRLTVQRRLTEVGENIRLARLRRRISATMMAERAGITRTTLRSLENGDPGVSFGSYATVLFVLGLDSDLLLLGCDDVLGRKLQDIGLETKKRAPKRKQTPTTAIDVAVELQVEPRD